MQTPEPTKPLQAEAKLHLFGKGLSEGGHLWWKDESFPLSRKQIPKTPWDLFPDTTLCRPEQAQGIAWLWQKEGWTALAFWDRSRDTRYKSNTVLVWEGTHTFEEMLEEARRSFPRILEKIERAFPIVLEKTLPEVKS